MKNRQNRLIILLLFLFTALSTAVYAQANPFDLILGSVERVASLYGTYYYAIDALLYAVILIGVAQFALSQQFEGRGGKAVIIGMGIALSVGAAVFERQTGFKLVAGLGPIAVILTLILFIYFFYRLFSTLGANGRLIGMAMYALGFFYINAQFPQIGSWFMSKGGWLAFAWSIGHSLAIIFFLWVIIEGIMKLVQASGLGAGLSGLGGGGGGGNTPQQPPPNQPQGGNPQPAPQTPNVSPPTNVQANAADRDVVIRWGAPAGGNPSKYVITRYKPRRFRGSPKPDKEWEVQNIAYRAYVDSPSSSGNYMYSVQAVENGVRSEAGSASTGWVTTRNSRCNFNIGGFGNAGGRMSAIIRLSCTGNRRISRAGNITLHGIAPNNTEVRDYTIPIDQNWLLLPRSNDATTAYGSINLNQNDYNILSGGGGNPIVFIFDTQYVGVN
ncbi:MAG: hypothetical protein R6U32_06255 [Candidatus Woesearchaeota archaeon]